MQAQRPGDLLLVDADEYFLNSVANGLRTQGHRVETCSTAHAARRLLENRAFDVVVCAHRLPDQRGERLCHFIKSDENLGRAFVALMLDMSFDSAEAERIISQYYSLNPRERVPWEPDDIVIKPVRAEMLAGRIINLLRMSRYLQEINNTIGALIEVAQGVEEQDPRAHGHCKRLALMAIELGTVLGCDEYELTALERAGYLHDIGMVAIHGAVPHKIGDVTPSERLHLQSHTVRGEELCRPVVALRSVLPIIRGHHERADGSGYPDRLRGDAIPKLVQIFAIPHLYEALRLERPHRHAINAETAVTIMGEEVSRGFWNADYFEAFAWKVLPSLEERLNDMKIGWPS
jgi:putative two-component system response regulator